MTVDIEAIRAKIKKAFEMVFHVCKNPRQNWVIRVPVDEDRDSDIVICAGLKAGENLCTAYEELEAKLKAVEKELETYKGRRKTASDYITTGDTGGNNDS
jgi:septation ring formation regulator EzrA